MRIGGEVNICLSKTHSVITFFGKHIKIGSRYPTPSNAAPVLCTTYDIHIKIKHVLHMEWREMSLT